MAHPSEALEGTITYRRSSKNPCICIKNSEGTYSWVNFRNLDGANFELYRDQFHDAYKIMKQAHDEAEIERILSEDPLIVGVNNRNLSTFVTDLAVTERLLPMIPDHIVKVSESGIAEPEDAWRARDAGADAVLCGEALMRAEDPEAFVAAMKEA